MDENAPPVVFRSRKRKSYRRIPASNEDGVERISSASRPGGDDLDGRDKESNDDDADAKDDDDDDDDDDDNNNTLAAALRAIKRRAQPGSIGFGLRPKVAPPAKHEEDEDKQITRLEGVGNRFTHQTGLVPDLNDKHMNAFIESRLALSKAESSATDTAKDEPPSRAANPAAARKPAVGQLPTTRGKLMEVDLHTTEALQTADRQRQGPSAAAKQKQPWRGKGNRRGSDDMARDVLVDEFLHKYQLDIYETPPAAPATAAAGEQDGDADARLAAEFRAGYMAEAAARRRQKKKPPAKPKPKNPDEILKGPKLGGSRNVRSQVRNALLKETRDRK